MMRGVRFTVGARVARPLRRVRSAGVAAGAVTVLWVTATALGQPGAPGDVAAAAARAAHGSAAVHDRARAAAEAARPPRRTAALQDGNVPYDGRFTFARIRFRTAFGMRFGGLNAEGQPPWEHDFPRAERNFLKILEELTLIRPHEEGHNVFTTDDPELSRFPVAYLSEPGFWVPTEEEVEGLSDYLRKGGFMIADDFRGRDWFNFEDQMRRVIPEGRFVQLDGSEPIFDAFFRIEDLHNLASPYGVEPIYLGLYEDNDPAKRLMVIANYNNDIGEYWEFSDVGYFPIDLSNEAYKLGVNYIVYALTH
ncbi:MAG: DUF4159 domain-containing protein [Gemmatimonadetes bacterium]|nr:MAG: DUF4159 domain-containing protein [Gemmatimonadota bacterium]